MQFRIPDSCGCKLISSIQQRFCETELSVVIIDVAMSFERSTLHTYKPLCQPSRLLLPPSGYALQTKPENLKFQHSVY